MTHFNCRCISIPTKETDVSEKSVYKPSREGAKEIPLSFTGRHLLQSLREAICDYRTNSEPGKVADWGPLSRVRERIAEYMSDLEKKVGSFFLGEVPQHELVNELDRRGYAVREKLPPWHRRSVTENVNELLDRGFTVSVSLDYRSPPDKSFKVCVDGVVNAEQAQRIGQHIIEKNARDIERHNQKININAFRGPLDELVGKAFIVEMNAPARLFDYIARPRPPHQYLQERTFKAYSAEEARKIAVDIYSKDGYRDFEFDLFVKTQG